jgi:hypothetical protein
VASPLGCELYVAEIRYAHNCILIGQLSIYEYTYGMAGRTLFNELTLFVSIVLLAVLLSTVFWSYFLSDGLFSLL